MNLQKKTRVFIGTGLLSFPCILQADAATYFPESQSVLIPTISTEDTQGAYHDVILEFVRDDLWRVKDVLYGEDIRGVENVRVLQTDSFPVQVFLEVKGGLGGCGDKTKISQRRVDDTFKVSIQRVYSLEPSGVGCTLSVTAFSWVIPLPVYGLTAGTYHYSVNGGGLVSSVIPSDPGVIEEVDGGLAGSFVLDADNILEDE